MIRAWGIIVAVLGLLIAPALAQTGGEQVASGGLTCAGCTTNALTLYNGSALASAHISDSGTALTATEPLTLNMTGQTGPGLTISGGSTTGSSTAVLGPSITGTLNTTATVLGAGFYANLTNTASGAGTTLMDLQVGGVSEFSVDMGGNLVSNIIWASYALRIGNNSGGGNNAITSLGFWVTSNSALMFSQYVNPGDEFSLSREEAYTPIFQGGANALKLKLCNTWTSATSFECGVLDWQTVPNTLLLGTEKGSGGGSARNLELVSGGTNELDYGVTNASKWTFAAGIVVPSLILTGNPTLATSTTGAGAETFTNSPCTGLTTEQWVPVSITGQTGTWYVPACQ